MAEAVLVLAGLEIVRPECAKLCEAQNGTVINASKRLYCTLTNWEAVVLANADYRRLSSTVPSPQKATVRGKYAQLP
jgi:hypothetical protein